MIFDLLRDRPGPDDVADVCIVGAGAAGIVLAVELARQGKSVLIVEGGGREIEEPAQEPYRSEVVGLTHRGIHTGRFRVHGGTTTKWGGQILELNPEDFERRNWIAGSGWPFAKTELDPFYRRALELEGVSGAIQRDGEVWHALGLKEPEFAGLQSYLSRWCPEPNFARLHAGSLEQNEAVRIWLHANAVELLMEQEAVRGLRCRTQTGVEAVFQAKQFVFCMGTIECVRFFLQPRDGGLPWNRSGLLGHHFQDHVDANAAQVQPRSRRAFATLFDNIFLRGYKYHPKVRLRPSEQEKAGLLNCAATMYFQSDIDETLDGLKGTVKHLLRGRFGELGIDDAVRMVQHAPVLARQSLRYALQHRAYNPASATIKLRVHCEQRPDSASSITLGEEKDSLGLWRTRLDWRISELELSTIRYFAQTAAKALDEVAEVTLDPSLRDGDDIFLVECDDSNHHMGGMRMAISSAEGVVSPELLLHGTRNCFVCSGAVFPTSGFSNPTHTVLALAVRLADHLSRA